MLADTVPQLRDTATQCRKEAELLLETAKLCEQIANSIEKTAPKRKKPVRQKGEPFVKVERKKPRWTQEMRDEARDRMKRYWATQKAMQSKQA